MTTFKSKRELTTEELREVLLLMENQDTTDAYKNTSISINGDYACIDADIDECGNVTIL